MAVDRQANQETYTFKSTGMRFDQVVSAEKRKILPTAVGIKTPVQIAENGDSFLVMNTSYADQVHDNLVNLIMTNHGERLAHPDFGANLMELSFEMATQSGQSEAINRISTTIARYMPYIVPITFEPIIERFDNKDIAKSGVKIVYSVPKLNVDRRSVEVIIFAAT